MMSYPAYDYSEHVGTAAVSIDHYTTPANTYIANMDAFPREACWGTRYDHGSLLSSIALHVALDDPILNTCEVRCITN